MPDTENRINKTNNLVQDKTAEINEHTGKNDTTLLAAIDSLLDLSSEGQPIIYTSYSYHNNELKVWIHGIEHLPEGATLALYKRSTRKKRWSHPIDLKEDHDKYPSKYRHNWVWGQEQREAYPQLHSMIGEIETILPITEENKKDGYVSIRLSEYLVPICKPWSLEEQDKIPCTFIGDQLHYSETQDRMSYRGGSVALMFRIHNGENNPIDIPIGYFSIAPIFTSKGLVKTHLAYLRGEYYLKDFFIKCY